MKLHVFCFDLPHSDACFIKAYAADAFSPTMRRISLRWICSLCRPSAALARKLIGPMVSWTPRRIRSRGGARSGRGGEAPRLSLSQIRSEHIDDAILRELALSEWLRLIARRVISARPSSRRGVFERRCSIPGKKAECGADGARQRSRRDQGIRVGSSRSGVRSVHSAKASAEPLACRECPWRKDVV